MIRRALFRLIARLTRAPQPDAWVFRSRAPRHPNDAAMIDGARHSIPEWVDEPEEDEK